MRRNLRLDWRALALLGALLSIIIDWPGLMYAMPTILPPVAVAAPTDTINIINNDKVLNFYPLEHDLESHVRHSVKDEFTVEETAENLEKFSTDRPFSDLQTERTTTNYKQLADVSVSVRETEMQQVRLTTNEKQQQEVNENLNSISQKSMKHNDSRAAATDADSLGHNATELHNSRDDDDEEEEVSSTNTHIMDSTTPETLSTTIPPFPSSSQLSLISSTTTESSAKIQSTLMPTTITDSDDNIALTKEIQIEDKIPNIRSTFQFSSSHHIAILSRTERSIRSSSSTMDSKSLSGPLSYTSTGSGTSTGTGVGGEVGRGMGRGAGGIVRRSSDVGGGSSTKTKRLNNSRNLHYKNNLDRNERSTVSHLSGPSRRIQMYIKNRFLQLMPDGTVNGTPDDQSEYSKYYMCFFIYIIYF